MTGLLEILDVNTSLAISVVALSFLWWMSVRRPPRLPPGPGLAVPLLGHLLRLERDPRQQFAAWRRQYGDVFSLYLGNKVLVVLSGHKAIKDALVKHADAFSDRPHFFIVDLVSESKGVVATSGPVWKAQRKVSLEILRKLGMGKNTLAEKIQEEVNEYVKVISESQSQPLDLTHLTKVSVSNNICSIVFGTRFQYEDKGFERNLRLMDDLAQDAGAGATAGLLPFLMYLPGDFFKLRSTIDKTRLLLNMFIKPFVDDHIRRRFDENPADDFIGAYISEVHKHRNSRGHLILAMSIF